MAVRVLRRSVLESVRLEFVRLAESMPAGFADPVIVHQARTDMLGQERRQQHVAALRTSRQPDVPCPGRRLTHRALQRHGEVSSAGGAFSPSPPIHQKYEA